MVKKGSILNIKNVDGLKRLQPTLVELCYKCPRELWSTSINAHQGRGNSFSKDYTELLLEWGLLFKRSSSICRSTYDYYCIRVKSAES